jgi:putative spermidine/putrescine transport system permease protein
MAAVTSPSSPAAPTPEAAPAGPRPRPLLRRRRRRQAAQRWAVVAVLGGFFLLPLVAMVEFTTRAPSGSGRTLDVWRTLADVRGLANAYPDLFDGVVASAWLVILTVGLMLLLLVPTMVWVRLRLPWLRRPLEFVCLLPLIVPAIVLVVGLAPVYAWVAYFLGPSSLTLCFAYTVLVLPYAYRALDTGLSAVDVRTLSEAARSLGAGWGTVIARVVLPNIRSAVLSASFLSVALVLGEFTVANLLSRANVQVAINLLGKRDPSISIAVSLAALLLAFALLLVLSLAGVRRHRRGPRTGAARQTVLAVTPARLEDTP